MKYYGRVQMSTNDELENYINEIKTIEKMMAITPSHCLAVNFSR